MNDGLVEFPLPILLQWFSAHALGEGLVSLSEIARSGAMLDRWRYALVIAAGLFDHDRATDLLAPLARKHPGFVSQIVGEGLTKWGLDDAVSAASGTDAAERIRQAMDALVSGLGPLAKLIAPLQRSGDLLPVAARSSGARLTVGWYRGRDVRPAASELPQDFSIFSSPEWTMCRAGQSGTPLGMGVALGLGEPHRGTVKIAEEPTIALNSGRVATRGGMVCCPGSPQPRSLRRWTDQA